MKIILAAAISASALLGQGVIARAPGVNIVTEDIVEGPTAGSRLETRRLVISNGQNMEFVSGVNVGPTVTKAPYSAEAVTESIQTLYDGNRIVQRSSTKQYRDSEGRERREEGAPLNVVFITDPVAKLSLTLHPDAKTAEKMGLGGGLGLGLRGGTGGVITAIFDVSGARTAVRMEKESVGKEEDLGTRMIEGVEAKGTRVTTTIPQGEIGNDRPIDIVDERWYSPELQLTVLTRHADPRSGENIYKLVNIQRLEPVRSLFEIPPGYTVHEATVFQRSLIKEEE